MRDMQMRGETWVLETTYAKQPGLITSRVDAYKKKKPFSIIITITIASTI
jgi:hypothetical protein